MAVVRYKCDTCERVLDAPRNEKGLEIIGRCIITDGCRGELYQEGLLQDFQRGEFPPPVIGLDDWIQRRALYNHDQAVPRIQWIIQHDLGICPIIQVLVDRSEKVKKGSCVTDPDPVPVYVEPNRDDYQLDHPDENTSVLTFERAEGGIAQAITKTTALNRLEPVKQADRSETSFQLTNQSELTLGFLEDLDLSTTTVLYITFLNQQAQNSVEVRYEIDNVPSLLSPWRAVDRLEYRGEVYEVRSFDIITAQQQQGTVEIGSPYYISRIEVNHLIQTADPDTNSFIIQGDVLKQFPAGVTFNISGGVAHSGDWSVRTSSYDALLKQTTIYVNEMVINPTSSTQEMIETKSLVQREVLYLLATPPFQTTDRIVDEVVDGADITATNAVNNTFLQSGDLFMAIAAKQQVFPLLRRVL